MNTQILKNSEAGSLELTYGVPAPQRSETGRTIEIEPYMLSDQEIMLFNFNITLAKSIMRKRKELGWTQEKLSEKSGVNRITIARIEKFQHTASVEVIIKLLYALDLKLTVTDG